MRLALDEARKAPDTGDAPIGAVAVYEGRVIAASPNRREADADPTAHAEVLAMREAARKIGHWRLDGVTLYVTKEPCVMCAGTAVMSRVTRVVFGVADPKYGAAWSLYNLLDDERLNHRAEVASGLMADECGKMLSEFFGDIRRGGKGDAE
jgi:tRNA(Arg) A34 adenosine deaminase TadA